MSFIKKVKNRLKLFVRNKKLNDENGVKTSKEGNKALVNEKTIEASVQKPIFYTAGKIPTESAKYISQSVGMIKIETPLQKDIKIIEQIMKETSELDFEWEDVSRTIRGVEEFIKAQNSILEQPNFVWHVGETKMFVSDTKEEVSNQKINLQKSVLLDLKTNITNKLEAWEDVLTDYTQWDAYCKIEEIVNSIEIKMNSIKKGEKFTVEDICASCKNFIKQYKEQKEVLPKLERVRNELSPEQLQVFLKRVEEKRKRLGVYIKGADKNWTRINNNRAREEKTSKKIIPQNFKATKN